MSAPWLEVNDLEAFYGDLQVLFGVSIEIREGEAISLLGRNGAGKTTFLKALMGLVPRRRAQCLKFRGEDLQTLSTRDIARRGLGYCPDDRGIFASLNVSENLLVAPQLFSGAKSLDEIYAIFPRLRERAHLPGKKISGGEQQMLAIARLLRSGSRLLLLDEPTEGLAPLVVEELGALLQKLKLEGYSILLVEQNSRFAQKVADRHYLFDRGRVKQSFSTAEFSKYKNEINMVLGLT